MAEITLTGISQLEEKLRNIEKSMRDKLSLALESEMQEKVVDRAKNEFVPVGDSGKLRDSIRLEKARVQQGRTEGGQYTEGADLVVSVTAGGDGIDYAVAIHEYPSEYNPPTWENVDVQFRVGGAKYIERPLFEAENGLVDRLAGKVKLGQG
jgi:hypothetical protein